MLLSWTINLPQKCTWIMFYLVVLWCYKNKYLAVVWLHCEHYQLPCQLCIVGISIAMISMMITWTMLVKPCWLNPAACLNLVAQNFFMICFSLLLLYGCLLVGTPIVDDFWWIHCAAVLKSHKHCPEIHETCCCCCFVLFDYMMNTNACCKYSACCYDEFTRIIHVCFWFVVYDELAWRAYPYHAAKPC